MIDKLNQGFAYRQAALGLRHERQEVLAANIANADTPGYKARDMDFKAELNKAMGPSNPVRGGLNLQQTSERHLSGGGGDSTQSLRDLKYRIPDQPSLDGNTVDMERERAQFLDNSMRYEASLTLMSSYIQGLKKAMQPE